MALHWHGDTFSIPPECIHIAKSEGCKNQAFVNSAGNVIGLQFHLEATIISAKRLIANCYPEGGRSYFIQAKEEILARENYFMESNCIMNKILNYCQKLFLERAKHD